MLPVAPTRPFAPLFLCLLATLLLSLDASPAKAVRVLLVVEEPGSLDPQDAARKSSFESWGHTVTLVDDSASQSTFDSLFSSADIVYVSENVNASDIGFKLRESPIGVVSEHGQLDDEMGFTDANSGNVDASSLQIVDNSHPLTSGFSLGPVTITSSNQTLVYSDGSIAPGARILATLSGNDSLFVFDTGAALVNTHNSNSTASGPRVRLPWGESSFAWTALNSDGLMITRQAIIWAADTSSLIGHWRLDETSGATAIDSSRFGVDGVYSGSPTPGELGLRGFATRFDGSSDSLSIPATSAHDAINAVSIAAWVRPDTLGDSEGVFVRGTNSHQPYGLALMGDGRIRFRLNRNSPPGATLSETSLFSNRALATGEWSHVAAVYSGDALSIYINGKIDATVAASGLLGVTTDGSTIGADLAGSGGFFDGLIDDLVLYDRALTTEEITAHFGKVGHYRFDETSGTVAADSSGAGNDAVYENTPTLGSDGVRGASATLNDSAVDQYVNLPSTMLDGARSVGVAWWMKTDRTGVTPVLSSANSSFADELLIAFNPETQLELLARNINTSISVDSVADGDWRQFVCQYDRATGVVQLYIDGELHSTNTRSALTDAFVMDPGGLVVGQAQGSVGGSFDPGQIFRGEIDDLCLFNRMLTEQEVAEHYGLLGHWRVDETNGTTAADSSLTANDGAYENSPTINSAGPYPGAGVIATEFDGVDDHVSIPARTAYDITEHISVAAWVRVEAFANSNPSATILGKGDTAWRLQRNGVANTLEFSVRSPGFGGVVLSTTEVNDGRWHHVVATYDGSAVRIYIDGALDGTLAYDGLIDTNTEVARIGENSEIAGRNWNGGLFDVRLYNRALSEKEIAELYGLVGWWRLEETSGSVAADSSGAGNHGEVVGIPDWSSDSREGSGSIELNGTNHVEIPTIPIQQGDAAVSGWARLTSADSRGAELINVGNALGIRLDDPLDDRGSIAFTYNGTFTFDLATSGRYQAGTGWHHFAASYDNTALTTSFYIDGTLVQTAPTAGPLQIPGTADITVIGDHPQLFESAFTGNLDDVRIYNRAISFEEVREQFFSGSVPGVRIIRWVEVQ